MAKENDDLILIAVIRRAHGVHGAVMAESYTFDNRRFKKLKEVRVKRPKGNGVELLTLSSAKETVKGLLLTFNEITDRTKAEEYYNAEILILAEERLPLKKGLAYLDEYPGMAVIDKKTKAAIGVVKDIMEMPAGNILVVRLDNGTERLITMAGEEVTAVDRSKREVTVSLLEEL